ncbi:MAG TPA: NADH-quinone oxidoreductase subunit C [Bacteroidetes bacterium]|nr:NADH-quinone oxidoreductase subunit C [Bacteroidota bacterium]
MERTELQNYLTENFEGLEFGEDTTQYLTITVPKEKLREFMFFLRDAKELAFDFMVSLTAVDWFPKNFGVVYHLESTKYRHLISVHVNTGNREDDITIDTVSDIYPTANFHEREAYDLMGIIFKGHPDLRRLFLTDDWVGHPLRKDYVDEANMIIK